MCWPTQSHAFGPSANSVCREQAALHRVADDSHRANSQPQAASRTGPHQGLSEPLSQSSRRRQSTRPGRRLTSPQSSPTRQTPLGNSQSTGTCPRCARNCAFRVPCVKCSRPIETAQVKTTGCHKDLESRDRGTGAGMGRAAGRTSAVARLCPLSVPLVLESATYEQV